MDFSRTSLDYDGLDLLSWESFVFGDLSFDLPSRDL